MEGLVGRAWVQWGSPWATWQACGSNAGKSGNMEGSVVAPWSKHVGSTWGVSKMATWESCG